MQGDNSNEITYCCSYNELQKKISTACIYSSHACRYDGEKLELLPVSGPRYEGELSPPSFNGWRLLYRDVGEKPQLRRRQRQTKKEGVIKQNQAIEP